MEMTHYLTTFLAAGGERWGDGPGWFWGPLMLTLWVGLITGAVWLMSRAMRSRERSGVGRARDILAERFARGELTADEYQERLAQLS